MPERGPANPEDRRQLEMLVTTPGEPDSGRVRYAAAMYFYQRGMISAECLEVYRICARIDHEDPQPFLARLGFASEIEALRSTACKERQAP